MNNPIIDLLHKRTTLRRYADRPVPKEIEDAILDAALRAPTGSNMMFYSILVIRDKDLQKKLQLLCRNQPYISQAPLMLIFCADYQRLNDYFHKDKVPEKCAQLGKKFMHPSEKSFMLCSEDSMLAAANAVIAAESFGLGSCFIGHIKNHREQHRELLGLPPLVFPDVALLIGYPEDGYKAKLAPRFDKRFIVHENRYHRLSAEELDEMFADRFRHTSGNRWGAENAGQQLYFSKYDASDCYFEGIRSVRKAIHDWCIYDGKDVQL